MKALSLWQPWASLIYDGRKTIETRHWEMKHRGTLAIHAAKRIDAQACRRFGYDPKTIPAGAILCTVEVLNCVRFPDPAAPPDEYGNFEPGRYGFLLELGTKFREPIICTGRQGLFNWSPFDIF